MKDETMVILVCAQIDKSGVRLQRDIQPQDVGCKAFPRVRVTDAQTQIAKTLNETHWAPIGSHLDGATFGALLELYQQ
jgi:hypothetical protein